MPREVKKLTWDEFLKEFDSSVHSQITAARNLDGTDGLAILQCEVMDSSRCGQCTAMAYGPDRTFKSLADIESKQGGVYVNGLPSSAAFLIAYTEERAA